MLEIRFHGRGGQGTVVATILLAKAYFEAGYSVQSFPVFGVERRGAPVEAYLRLDQKEIWIRSNVYAPDHVVVLDRTLLEGVDVTHGLKPGGWILINASCAPENLGRFSGFQFAWVDATRIALNHQLGSRTHPIVNTAVLGAFARVHSHPPVEALVKAIKEDVPGKPDENIQAARDAFEEVQIMGLIQG
jgi:pyruvate ferredoxin oxidoreductase gamma subunit/2-oxoisovalerate ferredoxin oxidoreductase gamma subunit